MKTILIRQAQIYESDTIIPLLMEAMGEIAYRLSGTEYHAQSEAILKEHFCTEHSRISHQRCWVIECDGEVCGAIVAYRGDQSHQIDEWIRDAIRTRFNYEPRIDPECEEDEFYIDSLAINHLYRGERLSARLIEYVIQIARVQGLRKVSLIVDEEKPAIQHYYHALGFNEVGEKIIYDHRYTRMIYEI